MALYVDLDMFRWLFCISIILQIAQLGTYILFALTNLKISIWSLQSVNGSQIQTVSLSLFGKFGLLEPCMYMQGCLVSIKITILTQFEFDEKSTIFLTHFCDWMIHPSLVLNQRTVSMNHFATVYSINSVNMTVNW